MSEPITREDAVACLENNWGGLIERFRQFSAEEQRAYLDKQGYPNLAGLLGHVFTWWEEGSRVIQGLVDDPNMPSPDYDVDAFNAQALERYANVPEAEVVARFEAQRAAMIALVKGLSDDALQFKRINKRLQIEICGHYEEHEI